jgi:hypothetical protein
MRWLLKEPEPRSSFKRRWPRYCPGTLSEPSGAPSTPLNVDNALMRLLK